MMEWDCRMKNDHCVKILKAAVPFLDVPNGESIDLEGLLQAVQPLVPRNQRKILDVFLQFFQMRRMMDLVQVMQTMQQMTPDMGGQAQDVPDDPQPPVSPQEAGSATESDAGSSPDWFSVLQTLFASQPAFGAFGNTGSSEPSRTPEESEESFAPVLSAADSDSRKEGEHEPVNF